MKTLRIVFTFVFALLLCASIYGSESSFATGKLLDVQRQVQREPRSYLWDTPMTFTETARYQLQIQLGSKIYTAEFIPDVQPNGPIPSEWEAGKLIHVRVEKNRLIVKLSYGPEVETHIVKRADSKTP